MDLTVTNRYGLFHAILLDIVHIQNKATEVFKKKKGYIFQ